MHRATMLDIAAINRWCEADFTAFVGNPMNVVLIEGEGCAMFAWRGPGVYEVHVIFEQRGKEVLALAHRMLAYMRDNHSARMFWSAIPPQSRKVIMFARLMGWKSCGVDEFPHGVCEIFEKDGQCHI